MANVYSLEQIIQTIEQNETTYDIGLIGDKILFKDKNNQNNDIYINAQSFYDYLKNYFSKKMFTVESDEHPDTANNQNGNDNIIVWNDTGFNTRFEEYLTNNNIDTEAETYDEEATLSAFETIDNQKNN